MKMRRVLAVLLGGVVFVVGGIAYLTNINRLVENPEDDDVFDEDFDDDFFEDEEDEIEQPVSSEEGNEEALISDETSKEEESTLDEVQS